MLDEPRKRCDEALDAFVERWATARIDSAQEWRLVAQLYADIAAWFARQGDSYEVADHADRLFVEMTFRGPARQCQAEADRLFEAAPNTGSLDREALLTMYARLAARFRTELTSFERKRYDNLSHA